MPVFWVNRRRRSANFGGEDGGGREGLDPDLDFDLVRWFHR